MEFFKVIEVEENALQKLKEKFEDDYIGARKRTLLWEVTSPIFAALCCCNVLICFDSWYAA